MIDNKYLYEDQVLLFEEQNTLNKRLDDGVITKNDLHGEMKKAGRILILSNKEMSEQGAYEFYKRERQLKRGLMPTKRHYLMDFIYKMMRAFLALR
jgi:hypothetical protein